MAEPASLTAASDGVFGRIAHRLAGLTGWRRWLAAGFLGALASAALPPLYLVPVLWPAFTGLLWLLDGARRARGAFMIGWAFGAGHFLTGLYWVGIAFLVDAEQFALLMPFAVAGLAVGIGLFPAVIVLAVWSTRSRGVPRLLLFAAVWLAAEWLRSWILTGFPWNLIGSVWAFSDAMLQLGALSGIWGLSLLTLLAAAAPATLSEGSKTTLSRWLPVGATLLLLALTWAGGELRLSAAPPAGSRSVEGVALRLVQPGIAQSSKWATDLRAQHIADQMALTLRNGAGRYSHAIWPETAITYSIADQPDLRQALAQIVPPGGLLLSGAPRTVWEASGPRLWNSFHALDPLGEIRGTYDKFHLVPFGEYVPLKGLLGISKLTQGRLDFSPGPGLRTLTMPGLPPFGPLICYEVIFPGQVTEPGKRPDWLLNLTNDSWFGTSSGPYQHFASARMRAVEEGLPLVRVANSGISGVVDGYGRTLARLELNKVGVLDAALPKPIAGATIFSRVGNWSVLILFLLSVSAAYISRPLRRLP